MMGVAPLIPITYVHRRVHYTATVREFGNDFANLYPVYSCFISKNWSDIS